MNENGRWMQPERWIGEGLSAIGDGLTHIAYAVVIWAVIDFFK